MQMLHLMVELLPLIIRKKKPGVANKIFIFIFIKRKGQGNIIFSFYFRLLLRGIDFLIFFSIDKMQKRPLAVSGKSSEYIIPQRYDL